MNPFLWLITTIIDLYIWILIASAVLSWLVAFNVVNTRNQIVNRSAISSTGSPSRCCARSATSCPISAASISRR